MSVEFEPPPHGMDASCDHDGASWRFGGSQLVAVLAAAAAGLAVGAGIWLGGWALPALALVALVSAAVMAQSLSGTRVQVTLRSVLVERRTLWGSTRQGIRLDEITDQSVASSSSGDAALVLRTRDETVTIGSGCDPEHLAWLDRMIRHARALTALREQEEGREWTFLRKAPEDIDQLRGR